MAHEKLDYVLCTIPSAKAFPGWKSFPCPKVNIIAPLLLGTRVSSSQVGAAAPALADSVLDPEELGSIEGSSSPEEEGVHSPSFAC